MKFLGYRRVDGRVGVRNHVLVMATCGCSSDVARIVSSKVPGTVFFNNQNGCGQTSNDLSITLEVLSGFAANPNIYATLVVSLGCELAEFEIVEEYIARKTNKPLQKIVIQEEGGSVKAIEKAVACAQQLVQEASFCRREESEVSDLIVGTECGGSDPTSGLSANPVVGSLSDRVVDFGGTSILSETTEFVGAEHILAERGRTEEIKRQIMEIVTRYEKHLANVGEDLRSGQPSPGNKAGGITTLEEKSLGCIHKSGHRLFEAVYDYAQLIDTKGLVIMDTPGYDIASVTGMIAGGSQIVVFTTGRGTPAGNPIAPVIKITGNKETYIKMFDDIDFNTSDSIWGEKTVDQLGEELLRELIEVANGKQTRAELLGINEVAISRLCNYC